MVFMYNFFTTANMSWEYHIADRITIHFNIIKQCLQLNAQYPISDTQSQQNKTRR